LFSFIYFWQYSRPHQHRKEKSFKQFFLHVFKNKTQTSKGNKNNILKNKYKKRKVMASQEGLNPNKCVKTIK